MTLSIDPATAITTTPSSPMTPFPLHSHKTHLFYTQPTHYSIIKSTLCTVGHTSSHYIFKAVSRVHVCVPGVQSLTLLKRLSHPPAHTSHASFPQVLRHCQTLNPGHTLDWQRWMHCTSNMCARFYYNTHNTPPLFYIWIHYDYSNHHYKYQ